VPAEGLADFVRSCGPEWVGLSLTMPLKHAVLPLLDGADETVTLVGAANTLVWRDGDRFGANTDVDGFVAALAERGAGPGTVERATVLGSGATAAAALAALSRIGVRQVLLVARRPDAADPLRDLADRLGLALETVGWSDADLDVPLVVSTVPAGAADALAGSVPAAAGVLFDVVYASWPTPLAAAWTSSGGVVLSGLDLLVHQAVGQIALMTGETVGTDVLRTALDVSRGSRKAAGPPMG
jgi:shikimate 5-dehydrogenase